MIRKASLLFLIFFNLACKKNNSSNQNSAPINQDSKKTTYSEKQNINYTTPLIINAIHPESIRIINQNGNYTLITSFADLFGTTYDYMRSFSINLNNGALSENTLAFLGEYKEVGFPKSPFYYEDLNGDGIKDLFLADHGKETPSLMINGQYPGFVSHCFYGKANGTFAKAQIADLTDVKRFYHNSAVGDMDADGDKDLVIQSFSQDEMTLFINNAGTLTKKMNITPNNQTGSVFVTDINSDNVMDLISAPYIDRANTPSTYIQRINISGNSFSKINMSGLRPFGANYGAYKVFGLTNPKTNKPNLFYFVEGGIGDQKIFRSKDNDFTQLDEISTVQNTVASNGVRDYLIMDLNFDGWEDIFFITNLGEKLNERVWLNKGDNTFENSKWEIDNSLNGHIIPLSSNASTGKIKFLCFNTKQSLVLEIYTKK
jgi:hypothetical protein